MKKVFTFVFATMLMIGISVTAIGQNINSVSISPSNWSDCTNSSVTILTTQLCINHTYVGISHNISGNTITVTMDWTGSIICQGALSQVQGIEQLGMVPSGTYSLVIETRMNGSIQNTQNQAITVAPCCAVATTVQGNTNVCLGESATLTGSSTGSTSFYWSQNGVNISSSSILNVPSSNTGSSTYYFVATNGSCSDSTAHTVTVNPIPVIDLGNDTTVCVGQSVLLNAATGLPNTTYSWSTGTTNSSIITNNPGTYTVTASINGCTDTDSVMITALSSPVFDLGNDTTICDGSSLALDATSSGMNITYQWQGSSSSTMPMITASTAGNYQVTAMNSIGCSYTDDITVTIGQNPVPNLGNDTTLCVGSSIMLDGNTTPAGTISWNGGSAGDPFLTVDSAGTYNITVTTDDGCVGTDNIVVSYSAVAVSLGDTLDLVTGSPITLDAGNAGSTYLWNTGATTQTIDVDSTGSFDVMVTDMFNCTASGSVVIVNTTSTNGLNINAFKVYPNPASNFIMIESDENISMVRIVNAIGQITDEINIQNQQQISIEHLSNGVYFLQFTNNENIVIGQSKLIKK